LKKLLVLLIVIMMIFIMSTVVMAEANSGSVYLDLAVSGSSTDNIDTKGPLSLGNAGLDFDGVSGYTVGGEYVLDSFKAVLEYSRDSFENTSFTSSSTLLPLVTPKSQLDYTAGITLAKVGYRVIHNDRFSLDAMAGYLGLDVTDIDYYGGDMNYTNHGPMAALDFSWNSKKLEISGTYGTTFGASPSMKLLDSDMSGSLGTVTDKSSTLTAYRIKVLYMFWDNIGMSLSYAGLKSSLKYTYSHGEKVDTDADYSGIALGVTCKF
jgi:hypothetical protein